MELILVRHAIAENREVFAETGKADEERPLISRGRKKLRQSMSGYKQILPKIQKIYTSPLVRAEQTAKVFKEYYKSAEIVVVDSLKPSTPLKKSLEWLQSLTVTSQSILIGHEPHLSQLAAYIITGKKTPLFMLKKGGMCSLEFFDKVDLGKATIKCIMQPSILRKVTKS